MFVLEPADRQYDASEPHKQKRHVPEDQNVLRLKEYQLPC